MSKTAPINMRVEPSQQTDINSLFTVKGSET